MQNNQHTKFILSPILNTLEETVIACIGIGEGIETQSLSEYVLQTTFLKMTGALEQKLKCICWEMATNDYEYRYRYLKKNYGECSRYEDKNSIFTDLVTAITKSDDSFTIPMIFSDINIAEKKQEYIDKIIKKAIKNQEKKRKKKLLDTDKTKMIKGMREYYNRKGLCVEEMVLLKKEELLQMVNGWIITIIDNTILSIWQQHEYQFYKNNWVKYFSPNFATHELFDMNLQSCYKTIVYNHRNKCAHNLSSYQSNLPTLKTLVRNEFDTENYFFRFSLLVLMDEIFIRLYKMYIESLHNI